MHRNSRRPAGQSGRKRPAGRTMRRPGPFAGWLWGVRLDALHLSSERRDGSFVIIIQGDLDIVTSRELDSYLLQARREHRHVILDLAGVDFMDTSSLAVIVDHWKKSTATGGTLALAGARYQYTKALWITGLAHRLPFYETVAEATKALSDDSPADG